MLLFVALLSILIGILTMLILGAILYSAVRYVPFVRTPRKVRKKMIDAAKLTDGEKVFDLGCGDGSILLDALAEKKVDAIGIEGSWIVFQLAKLRRWLSHEKLLLLHQNFFNASVKDADVVFCYLWPSVMQRLQNKFEQELKPGARVISYCFPVKAWEPQARIPTREDRPNRFLIYCYQR